MDTIQNKSENTNPSNDFYKTNIFERFQEPGYFTLLFCSGLINLIHIFVLLRSKRDGALSLLVQILSVDIISSYVAITEIVTLIYKTWYFLPELCPFFKGMEVLVNTLTIYLIISLNFHAISSWNLCELEQKKNSKNPLTSCDNISEAMESLINNESRFVTIDYRRKKPEISIILPTICIWIVGLSLSIPNFTLSSILKLKEDTSVCAVIDIYYGHMLHVSLLIFKIILPMVLLILSFFILLIKLHQSSTVNNILTKKMCEMKKLLILAIALSAAYFITSSQRQLLHFVHIVSYPSSKNINNFKMPPLYNNFVDISIIKYLAMLHYSGSLFRSLLSVIIVSKSANILTELFKK